MEAKNKTPNYLGLAADICRPAILPPETDELPLKKRVELLEKAIVDISSEFAPIKSAIDDLNRRLG